MKINFDDIITKANARKDALVNFSAQANALGELMNDVDTLGLRMDSLKAACEALDAEAVQMVGQYKVNALRHLSARYIAFVNGLSLRDGSTGPAISTVVDELVAEVVAESKR